jgi:PTS system ascorbate-specific IIA component
MPDRTLPPLPEEAVTVHATAADWRDAVGLVAKALARAEFARIGYGADMVRMIEEHGPYVVIAPGLALAHARPGPRVLARGMAVVTLAEPVPFGHPHYDPVRVVVGLASTSPEEHLVTVAAVANVFNDEGLVDRLAAAETIEQIRATLGVD